MADQPYCRIRLSEIKGVPRPTQGKAEMGLMVESISAIGLLHAPVVTKEGNGYRLVAGAHRCAALKVIGDEHVWVHIIEGSDSAERLAFLDENLIRKSIPPAMRDDMWAARRKLTLLLNPAAAPEAKKAEGGKTHGRGRPKKGGTFNGPPIKPSNTPNARAEEEAIHRKEAAAPTTWGLYSDGKLTQTQVSLLVAVKDTRQQSIVAEEVAGKSIEETKRVIKEANLPLLESARLQKAILSELMSLQKICRQSVRACGMATQLFDKADGVQLDVGLFVVELRAAIGALSEFEQLLKGDRSNGRHQATLA